MNEHQTTAELSTSGISRRSFFGYAGALAGAGLLSSVASCKKDNDDDGIQLGAGDLGLLNYAYVLEQITSAFYMAIANAPFVGITPAEQSYLADIRLHEIAHRDLLKAFLGANALQELTPNFTTVDFSDRTSVLTTARKLEDLSVNAYNGVGKLFTNTAEGASYLMLIGKMVSVEARHSAIIREMLQPNSFADTLILEPTKRIDQSRQPDEVLIIAAAYIFEKLNGANLPSF